MDNGINNNIGPIGVFDSGFGGLTILREMRKTLPQYDYLFLGDNARAPYGTRSFSLVYEFTLQAVKRLFEQGCSLVILACNTASAKALRTIQQNDLPKIAPSRRVLGVIRPTVEELGTLTRNGNIGLFATPGTVNSQSYDMEIAHLYPDFKLFSHACPMWVPLVENREAHGDGADYFVKKDIDALLGRCADIDTVILGCTHYPILIDKIKKYMPAHISVVEQGQIVAHSLKNYLHRHPEIDCKCTKNGNCTYWTTDNADKFSELASVFVNDNVNATTITL